MRSRPLLIVVAAVLVLAGLMQAVSLRDIQHGDQSSPVQTVALAARVPGDIAGWTATDEPLGPSEFVQDAVARNLNYDDYVFWIYRRGGQSFGVYMAYWSPGRMPVQKVASHTPDRCWTENGWTCLDMRFGETVVAGGRRNLAGGPAVGAGSSAAVDRSAGVTLRPTQWRKFSSPQGQPQYVLYWHLVGDELYDYGDRFNARPHPLKWWRDTLGYAIKGSQEQYFIRLTSGQPFEELAGDAGFQAVLSALGAMGLAVTAVPPAER